MDGGKKAVDDAAQALRKALGAVSKAGVRAKAAGAMAPPDREVFARYARQHPGDPARGRKLFFDPKVTGCARCHRARGEGGDLARTSPTSEASISASLLIESVLDPSRRSSKGTGRQSSPLAMDACSQESSRSSRPMN